MHKMNLLTNYGTAMEMSLEGNRLIAHELAGMLGKLWKKTTHAFEALLHGQGQHQHLPPR